MSSLKRTLRVNGQSAEADRLDEAEKLRAGLRPPKAHRSYIDTLLDDAREDDERERERAHYEAVERQYAHIMANGGKAARARWADTADLFTSAPVKAKPLSTKADRLYFAYGMNTNAEQMARRCPNARAVGAYTLAGYRLVFRHYADIVTNSAHSVQGVLWWISESDEAALDKLEGFPRKYNKSFFKTKVRGKEHGCMFYRMVEKTRETPPSEYYLRMILGGYASFKLDKAPLVAAAQAAYDANPPMAPFTDNDEEFF